MWHPKESFSSPSLLLPGHGQRHAALLMPSKSEGRLPVISRLGFRPSHSAAEYAHEVHSFPELRKHSREALTSTSSPRANQAPSLTGLEATHRIHPMGQTLDPISPMSSPDTIQSQLFHSGPEGGERWNPVTTSSHASVLPSKEVRPSAVFMSPGRLTSLGKPSNGDLNCSSPGYYYGAVIHRAAGVELRRASPMFLSPGRWELSNPRHLRGDRQLYTK